MVRVTDCVNGSLIPSHHFGTFTNITSLMAVFHVSMVVHNVDNGWLNQWLFGLLQTMSRD
jgi:hypothetical protein